MPGRLHDRLGARFPNVEALERKLPSSAARDLGLPIEPSVRFLSEDRNLLYQYGPGLISVNAVRPYTGFEQLLEAAKSVMEALFDLTAGLSITRLGLRNINRFDFQERSVDLGSLFRIGLRVPRLDPQENWPVTQFGVNVLMSLDDLGRQLRQALRSQEGGEIFLDLDCFANGNLPNSRDDIISWLETSHDIIGDLFEACLTEKAKRDLNPIEQEGV